MAISLSINLLKNRHTISEKEYQKENDFFRYSLIAFVIVMVISLAGVVWQIVLSSRLSRIEAGIGKATQQLAGLSEASAQQIYLKSRLKLITAFLDDRSIARDAIQNIFSVSIPGVVVSGVRFTSDNTIQVQFTADNVIVLDELLNFLQNENGFFLQVVSNGISRINNGNYQLETFLTVPKEG